MVGGGGHGEFFLGLGDRRNGQLHRGLVAFELGKNGSGAVDHARRQTGEAGDLDAETALGWAGDDAAEEDDIVVPLLHRHGVVAQARQVFFQLGQLLVVGGEEGARPVFGVGVEMFDDGPSDGQAVVGRGAAADLVEDDE